MSTITKAANAHTTVTTGWTTPQNAYATTNDSQYATLVCPKNGTNNGDFGFPAFSAAEVPDHSTLTSVVFFTTYGLTVGTAGATVGEQARRNSTGATLGSEITRTAAGLADANGTATGCTITDLRTANELRVRARATKGSSNTACTAQIDRLYVVVTFTETVAAAAGALAETAVPAAAGRKATSKALGSLGLSASLALSGTKWEAAEEHSGSGTMTLSASPAAVGAKGALGYAPDWLLSDADSSQLTGDANGEPLWADGTEPIVASPGLSAAGAMGALGVLGLTLDATLGGAGTRTGAGSATLAATASLALAATKATTGSLGLTLSPGATIAGSKATDGSASATLSITLGSAGIKTGVGSGSLTLAPDLEGSGSSVTLLHLELVLVAAGSKQAVGSATSALRIRLAASGAASGGTGPVQTMGTLPSVRFIFPPIRRSGDARLRLLPFLYASGVADDSLDERDLEALLLALP